MRDGASLFSAVHSTASHDDILFNTGVGRYTPQLASWLSLHYEIRQPRTILRGRRTSHQSSSTIRNIETYSAWVKLARVNAPIGRRAIFLLHAATGVCLRDFMWRWTDGSTRNGCSVLESTTGGLFVSHIFASVPLLVTQSELIYIN